MLYGARRSVIEALVWLSNLLVLGAPRLSPLTTVKHTNGLNAPTATVQSRCLQNPPTICRRRCPCRRKTWKTRRPPELSRREDGWECCSAYSFRALVWCVPDVFVEESYGFLRSIYSAFFCHCCSSGARCQLGFAWWRRFLLWAAGWQCLSIVSDQAN